MASYHAVSARFLCTFWFIANEVSTTVGFAAAAKRYAQIMSPTATATKRKKKRKSASTGWPTWWPLLVGIVVTPLTVRIAGVMALAGPNALRALYPYVQLAQSHALGFSGDIAGTLSQAMMYLQFPLYGLLMALVLRSKGFLHALITTAIVHFGAVAIVVALSHL